MKIERKKSKDTSTLIFEGELTIYNVSQLKDELFADYDKLAEKIALNLQAVSEMDTAGVQLLLFIKKFFTAIQKPVFISKSNESVENILAALDVNTLFTR